MCGVLRSKRQVVWTLAGIVAVEPIKGVHEAVLTAPKRWEVMAALKQPHSRAVSHVLAGRGSCDSSKW
eukprot:4583478-Amphidinium_carterae.1